MRELSYLEGKIRENKWMWRVGGGKNKWSGVKIEGNGGNIEGKWSIMEGMWSESGVN